MIGLPVDVRLSGLISPRFNISKGEWWRRWEAVCSLYPDDLTRRKWTSNMEIKKGKDRLPGARIWS